MKIREYDEKEWSAKVGEHGPILPRSLYEKIVVDDNLWIVNGTAYIELCDLVNNIWVMDNKIKDRGLRNVAYIIGMWARQNFGMTLYEYMTVMSENNE